MMQLGACRELKAAMITELSERWTEQLDAASLAAPELSLALGVAPVGGGDFRLAVRLQRLELAASRVVQRLVAAAGGEAEIRRIGPVVPHHLPSVDAPSLQQRVRPLRIGASVGHPSVTAGTTGCFVRTAQARVALLSNNHVLADENRAAVGDPIWQPGAGDGGSEADRVATLAAFVPLSNDSPNHADAAIALLDDGVGYDAVSLGDGQHLAGLERAVYAADAVEKVGRTTGHSGGRVTAFEVDGVSIDYSAGVFVFDDLVEVTGDEGAFSQPGDSGSLVYTADELLGYGLLFAGSSGPDVVTYANPLASVLATLGVELLPEG